MIMDLEITCNMYRDVSEVQGEGKVTVQLSLCSECCMFSFGRFLDSGESHKESIEHYCSNVGRRHRKA